MRILLWWGGLVLSDGVLSVACSPPHLSSRPLSSQSPFFHTLQRMSATRVTESDASESGWERSLESPQRSRHLVVIT